MTALSDALTAATTGISTQAAKKALLAAKEPGGSTDASIATYIASLRTLGAAIKAAGGEHLQAGLKDTDGTSPITTNDGWIGRADRTKGEEGVEGFVLAGVDYVTWDFELPHRNF